MIVDRLARGSLVKVDLSGTDDGHGWQQLARPDGHVRAGVPPFQGLHRASLLEPSHDAARRSPLRSALG